MQGNHQIGASFTIFFKHLILTKIRLIRRKIWQQTYKHLTFILYVLKVFIIKKYIGKVP